MSQSNIEITKVVVNPVTQKITGMNLNADVDTSNLTINGEEAGGGNVQTNKTATIRENGTVEITPASGYDSMAKVTATVSVNTWVWTKDDTTMLIGGDLPTSKPDENNYMYYDGTTTPSGKNVKAWENPEYTLNYTTHEGDAVYGTIDDDVKGMLFN